MVIAFVRGIPPRPRLPGLLAAALVLGALAVASPAQARIHIAFGSRSELMLAVGGASAVGDGALGHERWPLLEVGAGYRIGKFLSFGVSGAGHYLGRASYSYDAPSGDFLVTNETLAMTPATVYVKLRFPVGRRGEPFLGAGAGGYTFWMFPDQQGAPRHAETRPGYHAEAGFVWRTTRFSPRVALRYDARSTAPDEVDLLPRGRFRVITATVGVQLP